MNMMRRAVLFSALPLALANQSYDYVVIGGGTSGLTVANRLSEVPDASVLVIEPGGSVLNNPNVYDVNGYGKGLGTDIDWAYQSVNQTYGGNVKQTLSAGKALSGTSSINGMVYARAEDVQVDAWGAIGNAGWDWKSLLPYYIKSENITNPTKVQLATGALFEPTYNGRDGPLKVAFSTMEPSNFTTLLNQSVQNLGLPANPDVNSGHMHGYSITPVTVDADKVVREDAARAYYWPYTYRPNLHVSLHTSANKITWAGGHRHGPAIANGVEMTLRNGTVRTVKARREVIVSAGALRSPGILEHSGIGNPA